MNGSLARISIVARTLLRQNRLLISLLLTWPFLLSGILVAADHGSPIAEDVSAILEQELFYGLVLVGLASSVALGIEQRAHRTHQVLGRAVGRGEYLLALGLSAYGPFAGYVLVWLLNAGMFAHLLHLGTPLLLSAVAAELLTGLILGAVGLLFSVLLPQLPATIATGVVLAALVGAGSLGVGGIARLLAVVTGQAGGEAFSPVIALESLGVAAAELVAAVLVFRRRDLALR